MKPYARRSGGISKTLILADFVTVVVAPTLYLLIDAGILGGKGAGIAVGVVGLVTRFLRQIGPKPK